MSKKPRLVFAAIHVEPDQKDIDWDDFLSLLEHLGATIRRQGGSATGMRLNGVYAVFHKPHPGHVIYQSDLKRIRRFLKEAGIDEVE